MCIHSEYDQTLAVGRGMCPFCQDETIAELRAALHSIIGLDHHNHGPESRATQIARDALTHEQAQDRKP